MAEEHTSGVNSSEKVELTETQIMVKEEVAKAFEAALPTYIEEIKSSLKEFLHQELSELETGVEKKQSSKTTTFKEFMACKPAEFKGEVDPLISQRWISDIEGTFETSHCDPADEVMFAGNQLKDRAKDWWELLRKEKGRDGMKGLTWAQFKELFLKRFCPQAAIDCIAEEFLHLQQKDESIDTITAIFFDKAKFCPDLLQTERMWINRYHTMLNTKYREFLTPSKCETLNELINCARERELELKRQEDRGDKRKAETETGSSKKAKFAKSFKKPVFIKPCPNCGKMHAGECRARPVVCYKCGKPGHLATQCLSPPSLCYHCYKPGHRRSECPELKKAVPINDDSQSFKSQSSGKKPEAPKPKGRAFQISAEEAKVTSDVVTGTFFVNSIPAYVLFDSGANRSFVSIKFVHHPSFVLEKLPVPLEVEVADSKSFLVLDIYRNFSSYLTTSTLSTQQENGVIGVVEEMYQHLKIRLEDTKSATNNFSNPYSPCDDNPRFIWYVAELDHFDRQKPASSIGAESEVKLLRRHNTVAIKRLLSQDHERDQQVFFNNMEMLASFQHSNIISLLGFCVEGSELILVFEKNPNRHHMLLCSSSQNDNCRGVLTWEKRLKIAVDIARALNYLHYEREDKKVIIHNGTMCCNVCLDENWNAKIENFEDAEFLTLNQEDEALYLPYISRNAADPIYLDYGGHQTHVARSRYAAGTLESMIDPVIIFENNSNKDSLDTYTEIAYKCVAETQDQRPTMKVVLKELEKSLLFQGKNLEPLMIPLSDIKLATNDFSLKCIHKKAELKHYGKKNLSSVEGNNENQHPVIIKRYNDVNRGVDFLTEIEMLTIAKHHNIITIFGLCVEGFEMILVIDYVSNGYLNDYLGNANAMRHFTWEKRLKICIDVAVALKYLHSEMKNQNVIINHAIQSNTIGLDENWRAKVLEFGRSVCMHHNPKYENTREIIRESDVYSFGVVLFEILCGRSVDDPIYLNALVLEQIREQIVPKSLTTFQEIAYQCLHIEREKRPTTKELLTQLKKALAFQVSHMKCSYVSLNAFKYLCSSMSHINNLEHLKIPLNVIKLATNNFSMQCIECTPLYCRLYIARLDNFDMENHSLKKDKNGGELPNDVIIKRFPGTELADQAQKIFFRELKMLSSVKHDGIVRLHGFCVEGPEMILVIANTSNGYLYNYLENLYSRRILTWERRLKICIDVARTLSYLHHEMEDQKVILNHYISSWNIGLDENWKAKIVDFGFSLFLLPNQDDEAVFLEMFRFGNRDNRGFLPPNIDPEYVKARKLRREYDIYRFGVVLLEILVGGMSYDPIYCKDDEKGLAPLARRRYNMGTLEDIIDPIIKEETNSHSNIGPNKDSLHTFIEIAHRCVAEDQNQRPTIKIVVKELEKALFQMYVWLSFLVTGV
ncbi:hypothetical protein E3N88_00128 [Mikania micrantha]|uniref:Protein kinase domain-containing protein n=1 Tax=Mikania micrantha TaxID=192012 RepID=A0A5N6PXN1_9ASTR|nr:hypothetical protein E3N88_00128 [Mikania micrantha]